MTRPARGRPPAPPSSEKLQRSEAPALSHIAEDLRALARPLAELVADPQNARAHPEENMAALRASLKRFGQRKPIVVRRDTGVVVAGNGTLAVARELGWTHVAASVQDMDDKTAKAYALADNRTAELATWNPDVLSAQLKDLADFMPALDLGFTEQQLRDLAPPPAPPDEPPKPWNPPKDPVSRRGEVYQIGPHRLMCGDATSAADVAKLLGDAKPRLTVTDPPYGVDYDPEWREGTGVAPVQRTGKVEGDDRASWIEAWKLAPGPVAYVWHASLHADVVGAELVAAGFVKRAHIVWRKPTFALSRGHYHWRHEPAWYAVRDGESAEWIGDRKQETVWDIATVGGFGSSRAPEDKQTTHGTQKPLECMERPIRHHKGDVYDPFGGSGTTVIAASRQGRRAFLMEIDPGYVDVIRRRWGDYARANGLELGAGAL